MNSAHELEIRHLKLVEAVAEEGTMTRAAERLGVSQSALSHQLCDLEAGLGVELFRRIPRGMLLTAAGQTVLACARTALREIRLTQERLQATTANDRGPLRISTECYTCYHWLPPRLKRFQQMFPHVEVQIVVAATRRPIPALLAGRLDVAIVASRPRGLEARDLFRDELVAVMSPEHPLARRSFLQAADFADQHLITYSLPPDQLTVFSEILTPAGVVPARHSRAELTEAIVEMVKAGMGIGVLARWAVAPHLQAGTLHAVRLTRKGIHRQWSAVTVRNRQKPAYINTFLDLLRPPF